MQPLYGISRHQRVGLSSDRLFIGQNHLICTFLFPDTMEMTSTKASSRAGSKWHREQNLKHANKHSGSSLSLSANCYAFKKTRGLHHQTLLESWCQESLCKTGHHFFLQENKHCVVCETGERMWVTHTHTLYTLIHLILRCSRPRVFIWPQDKSQETRKFKSVDYQIRCKTKTERNVRISF